MKIKSETLEDPEWAFFYQYAVTFPLIKQMPKGLPVWTLGKSKIREVYDAFYKKNPKQVFLTPDGDSFPLSRHMHLYLSHLIRTHGLRKWKYNGFDITVIDTKPIIVIRRVKK